MDNISFIFPGQGSQKLGMLSDLAESFPVIKSTFQEASDVIGEDLWEVIQIDSKGILSKTEITQPVLLTASVAIWRVWTTLNDVKPNVLAGHSLGEYSALVCSDALSFEEAVSLVHFRGCAMQNAVAKGRGKMAAILGLTEVRVQELCEKAQEQSGLVAPANINAENQIVISGEVSAVELAIDLCKNAGAKRAVPLEVSVPSHCELMRNAADELEERLKSIEFKKPKIDVVQNVDGEIQTAVPVIKSNLVKQLYMPVRWTDCVERVYRLGCNHILECGPGRVLTGLVKRSHPSIKCFLSDTTEAIEDANNILSQL